MLIARENDVPAGYILGRNALRWQPQMRPIYQAAVQMDAQRRAHGIALVEQICNEAKAAGQQAVQACCREGLEANDFWKSIGFRPICYLNPMNARKRSVICWRKPLSNRFPAWVAEFPKVAGYRARTVTQ